MRKNWIFREYHDIDAHKYFYKMLSPEKHVAYISEKIRLHDIFETKFHDVYFFLKKLTNKSRLLRFARDTY